MYITKCKFTFKVSKENFCVLNHKVVVFCVNVHKNKFLCMPNGLYIRKKTSTVFLNVLTGAMFLQFIDASHSHHSSPNYDITLHYQAH